MKSSTDNSLGKGCCEHYPSFLSIMVQLSCKTLPIPPNYIAQFNISKLSLLGSV